MRNVLDNMRCASLWWIYCLASATVFTLPLHTATGQTSSHTRRSAPAVLTLLDGHTLTAAQATRAIERVMAQQHIPGLGVAVINADKVVYLKAFGTRNAAQHAPLTDSTVMPALSLTDAVLAMSVMQLVDQQVIGLDTPIIHDLPRPLSAYPEYEALAKDARSQHITPRMLLDQTSGLSACRASDTNLPLTLHSDPGHTYRYSPEGLLLLSMAVEHVTKQPFQAFLAQGVLKEFSLPHTQVFGGAVAPNDYAIGYTAQAHPVSWPISSANPCGARSSTTLRDMTTFLQEVLRGTGLTLRSRTDMLRPRLPIVNFPTSVADKPIRVSYGLGWHVFSSPYGPGFYELASNNGWAHYMVAFDDAKTAVIFMSNSANGQQAFKALLPVLIGDSFTASTWTTYHP